MLDLRPMIGSSLLRPAGVVCTLALLAAGCSAGRTARFPGSPIPPTASAPAPADPGQPTPEFDPGPGLPPLSTRGSEAGQPGESTAADVSIFEVQAPALESTQAVTADLWPVVPGIDIPLNAKVLRSVEALVGPRKAFLEEGLSRGLQYLPMIRDVLRSEGLPFDLAFLPLVESAFKQNAQSRAQAKGIWQFMRGTARENGLAHNWYVDERVEAEKATRAAAKYLKTLNIMFRGDWALTLASYNAGPGRVRGAMKRSGRTDYWKLTASASYLPRETRNYVPLVMAAMIIARNPAQYGVDVRPIDAPRYETVTLPAAVDLRLVAEWVGTTVKAIQDLNPELRRWLTPVRASYYQLKVPAGTGDIVRAHLAQTDPSELAPLDWHTVEKGETLIGVARKLKVSRIDLAEANYLSTRARLQIGQRLMIPRAPALLFASQRDDPQPAPGFPAVDTVAAANSLVAPGSVVTVSDTVAASNAVAVAAQPLPTSLVHRVKRGDTLFSLAKQYRTTVASLKSWNRLRSNTILVGQRLTIFTEPVTVATN